MQIDRCIQIQNCNILNFRHGAALAFNLSRYRFAICTFVSVALLDINTDAIAIALL